MTKRQLLWQVAAITAFYAICIGVLSGFAATSSSVFERLKDLVPLFVALPAAYFGVVYQQRSSYVAQLRSAYNNCVNTVEDALAFTHLAAYSDDRYRSIARDLSVRIEELRGLARNVDGLYPFEGVKQIIEEFILLQQKNFSETTTCKVRRDIVIHWKAVREPMLQELDRPFPTFRHLLVSPTRPNG